jgi:hypothetical protein
MNCEKTSSKTFVRLAYRPVPIFRTFQSSRRNSKRRSIAKLAETLLFTMAVASVVWFFGSTGVQFIQSRLSRPEHIGVAKIVVAPGDTLWKIAETMNTASGQQSDKVDAILSLNPSLSSNEPLVVGQTILVPAQESAGQSDLHLARAVEAPVRPSM